MECSKGIEGKKGQAGWWWAAKGILSVQIHDFALFVLHDVSRRRLSRIDRR